MTRWIDFRGERSMADQPDWEMIEALAARKAGEVVPEVGEGTRSYLSGY